MNEQAIIDSYNLFAQNGYKKSLEEYKRLILSNPDALNDSYSLFQQSGYKKSLDDYKNLMGVSSAPDILQKKNVTTESPSEDGSLVSPKSPEAKPEMAQFGYQPGKPLPEPIPSVQPDQPKYTEEVMIGPMGISGVRTTGQDPSLKGKSVPKIVGELGKTFGKGVVKFPADVLETAAIATAAARNLAAKTGIVDETSALDISIPIGGTNVNFFQAAGEWKDLVNNFVPTDKDIESGFWGQTANALGQMVPILLTGAISGGARAIAKEAGKKGLSMQTVANYGKGIVSRMGTSQGVVTISQIAAPSYEQAKLEGATENEALGFAIQNAAMTFPLEMLPVDNLFKSLDNVLVGNKGVEVLKRAVVGGAQEGVTEGIQNIYENVTADAIYGTTRSFLDGVGESTAVGGTVGAIMNGVLTALLGRRARTTSTKEIEEIDKSITDVEQKIAQVESNNQSLKETVKVLEETKPRVLSYGSANYNFIESPEGALEYADDALTEEQAQGIIGNLTNSYKKIDFQIEEVEPDDPYQPTTYKIIGKPKAIQQEAVVESGLTPEERVQEIESIKIELRGDDNNLRTGRYNILNTDERYNLEKKLQTLIAEEDAFQKQAAGQVPVQSGATISEEVAQGEPQAEPQGIAEEGQEKITVFRGKGNNVMNLENDETLWVAEDEEVAKNYAGVTEEGLLDVEKTKVNKPINSIELPYKLETDVRASNIGNNLRSILSALVKEGKITKENISKASGLIREFEDKAGEGLELFTTKINKPESREAFSKAVQALGFDSILQKESAVEGGEPTNTYGVFKKKYESLVSTEPQVVTEAGAQEEVIVTPAPVKKRKAKAVPTPVIEAVIPEPVVETVTPEPAQEETFEQMMDRVRKEVGVIELEVKDFNSINEREYTGRKDKYEIEDDIIKADNNVFYAQRNIGSADDVEAAINEYNKAKEKVSELKEEINQIDNFNRVDSLIFDEIQNSKKPDYEYSELFKQDPRLATIQSYNDSIDFLKTLEGEEESISGYERDIKILEEDIKKYPIKEQVSKPVAKAKAAPKPTVKKPKAETKRQEIISRPAFTPITLARQWLLLGGKLLSKQSEENKRRGAGVGKGVREETGMSGIEMRTLTGTIDNKRGITIEGAAERIYENLNEELQASLEEQDIRNALIEILMTENKKTWIENQDRETSEDDQSSAREEFDYAQMTDEERADFDEYKQREDYYNYLNQNAKRLAKEYDAYIKSKIYQDYIEETYERDREGRDNAQNKNDGRGQEQGTDGGAASVQGTRKGAKATEVDTIINEETGTLESALNFLDGVDKTIAKTLKTRAFNALLGIPLTVVQGIVKGLKVLVQGGMKLRDAIKQISAENNISQEKLKDLLDLASIQDEFNTLMTKADKLIARQRSKDVDEKTIVSNLDKMVRDFYKDLDINDAQRKIMEREARAKMGVEARKAASIGRVIGVLKDITNVTREEKLKIISRIRELGRDVAKDLASEIREMAKGGTITPNQAASIIARTLNINPLNEASVSNFVEYMAKVFSKADYVGKMGTALNQIKQAKKNIKTKIGVSEDLFIPLSQLLSINPTLIPLNQLEKYLGILEDFGARKTVLSVDDRVKVLKQVNEILNEINNELSSVDVLADRFNNYDDKVLNEDGNLSYSETIKSMIDKGAITVDESELMKKYKSEILPQVEPTKLTDEEIKEQKKDEIEILKALKIDNKEFPLPSRDEKEDAINLAKLIKELSVDELMNLSLPDIKNIIKVIGNINNGYLPHYAKVSIEKLDAIKQGKVLSGAVEKANPLSFSKLYSRLKDKFTKKGAIDELIRANPLYYIDNVFGDFKTRDIFNSLLEKSSQALATFNSELKRVDQKIEAAQNKVLASFKQNPDEYLMSKFRMTTYMLQREYESNIGKKGVKPVAEYLKETIKHIRLGKSIYKEADADKLEQILKEVEGYTVEGKVDLDKFYNTFNSAEKNAIEVMSEINKSLGEKAAYTAAVVRGDKVELMDNYVHHNVLHEQNPMDETATPEFSDKYKNSMKPSTKAKSLIERANAITPLNFDLFTATHKGAKFILLDYNLTSPIRTARRTLIQAEKNLEEKGLMNKERVQIFNAINNAYEEALQNILTNNIVQDAFANEVVDFIQKQGYRAALAGTTRFQAELASNIANALLINPAAFTQGAKQMKLIASANGYEFMKNAKSKQTSRLYASDALSGKMVDPQILKQTSGIKGSVSRGALMNRTLQVYNLTLKKYVQNPVEYIADTLLSTPDKIVSMPLWFGSFMNEFKRITGEEVNQDMMINNDLDYMQKYSDAIQQATRKADQESVYSGASNNEFMGVLKGKLKANQGLTAKVWNNFNSFMTNFMNFDYAAARSAVYNLFNEGYMTKKKAAAVLAGITTRSVIYQVMVANMGAGIVGAAFGLAFDWEDDEEVDEKSYLQKLGRGLTNVLVGYTVGRNFGNAVRGMLNFGVEKINEEYLDFLRNGEYDFYKDNIAYTYLNVGERGDIDVPKIAVNMAGPYTPALNTAVLIGKNFGQISNRVMGKGPTKKEPEAIKREQMTVDYRIPLEVAGNLGLIPLYKDVKKAVNDEIYKDLRKAASTPDSSLPSTEDYEKLKDLRELKSKTSNEDEIKEINRKIIKIVGSEESKESIEKSEDLRAEKKKRLLYDASKGKRYDNESDMKRLNPSLWRRRFGPNSDWAKSNKAKKAVENKLKKVTNKREDKEVNRR
jgi:hypothetical protein